MTKKYPVHLTEADRDRLNGLVAGAQKTTRKITRARILLLSDAGSTDRQIGLELNVSLRTIQKVRRDGLVSTARGESHVAAQVRALAASPPPDGKKWTLRLLAQHVGVSHETLRKYLRKETT